MWEIVTFLTIILIITLVIGLLVLSLVRQCLVIVTVESQSMSPALYEGDRVLAFRWWPAKWIQKGDIVLVWPRPDDLKYNRETKPFGVIPFIKRVTGLPGDKIVSRFDELDDYHKQKLRLTYDHEGKKEWLVPRGHFFVRGDYPIGGFDSLSWGPIPYNSLLAVVIMKLPRPNANSKKF